MTIRIFDAPPSITRPGSPPHNRGRRPIVRVAWLAAGPARRDTLVADPAGQTPHALLSVATRRSIEGRRIVKNVVPSKPSATFERFGIDWTKDAATERERALREAFLTYETSCGPNGLISLVLLALVSRRQGAVAQDLQAAADFAEMKLARFRGELLIRHQAA